MPATDLISHPNLSGVYEVQILGAGAASAVALNVKRYQGQDDSNLRLLYFGGLQVSIGDAFVRPVIRSGAEEGEGQGAFTWFGPPSALEGSVKLSVARLPTNTAGGDLLSPAGTPVFRQGARVVVPASGEQAVNAWTGELLFEADGTTRILVP